MKFFFLTFKKKATLVYHLELNPPVLCLKKNCNFNLAMISMLDGAIFNFDTASAVLVFLIFFLLYLIATAGLSPYAHFIGGSGPAGIPNSGGPTNNPGGGGTPMPGRKS